MKKLQDQKDGRKQGTEKDKRNKNKNKKQKKIIIIGETWEISL